jgi:ribosomal protein S20
MKKSVRRESERNSHNNKYKNMIKNVIKKAERSKDEDDRRKAESLIMSRIGKKVLGKNNAIRKVSRLTLRMRRI